MKAQLKVIIFCLALGAAWPQAAYAQASQFRGYAEFENIIGRRISSAPFSLLPYAASETGLLNLLGAWTEFGSKHVFANGLPNSVNMLIWYTTLSGFAKDLGASCETSQRLRLTPEFTRTLQLICLWPADAAKSEAAMQAFWLALMGYTAPEEEFQAWRTFFLTSSYKDKASAETVAAMALAILMNPYLLLQD